MLIKRIYKQGVLFPEAIIRNGNNKGWGTFYSYKSFVKYSCNYTRYCKIFSEKDFN